jgi:hypothetical protein
MKHSLLAMLLITALCVMSTADAVESFQVKGLRLGQSPESACGESPVTTRLDDLIAKYKARAPELVAMETSECHIGADSFGGLNIDGGIDLLFLSGHLIQVKFSLEPMHWLKYAEIFSPLEQMYGEPTITKNAPFTTHTWRQGQSILSVSRADNSSGVESLEIILRDEASFQTYEERSDFNRDILGRLDDEQTKSDIRN